MSLPPSDITASTINTILERYPGTILASERPPSSGSSSSSSSKVKTTGNAEKDEHEQNGKNGKGKQETDTLRSLDSWRLHELPGSVQERATAGGKKEIGKMSTGESGRGRGRGAYLTKEEVKKLIRWKLKHGKFRPTLMSLIESNESSLIESTTRQAFSSLFSSSSSSTSPLSSSFSSSSAYDTPKPTLESVLTALNTLCTLRGIGPASASLILSIINPDWIPFFSDEVARYVFAADAASSSSSSSSKSKSKSSSSVWETKLKYDKKEYKMLLEGTWTILDRLAASEPTFSGHGEEDEDEHEDEHVEAKGNAGVDKKGQGQGRGSRSRIGAREVEMMAYVLGKERADLSAAATATVGPSNRGEEKDDDVHDVPKGNKTTSTSASAVGIKRKVGESDVEPNEDAGEPTSKRRSSRRRSEA